MCDSELFSNLHPELRRVRERMDGRDPRAPLRDARSEATPRGDSRPSASAMQQFMDEESKYRERLERTLQDLRQSLKAEELAYNKTMNDAKKNFDAARQNAEARWSAAQSNYERSANSYRARTEALINDLRAGTLGVRR